MSKEQEVNYKRVLPSLAVKLKVSESIYLKIFLLLLTTLEPMTVKRLEQ